MQLAAGADQQERRVAVLDDARLAGAGHIYDSEGGVADLAHAADGQCVHDGLGRGPNVHRAGRIFQSHGRRHGGQHGGFDAAAKAVGKDREDASFGFDFAGEKDVSRDVLAVLGPLAGIDLDKALGAGHGFSAGSLSSTSSGLNERTMELRVISESAAFSPSR